MRARASAIERRAADLSEKDFEDKLQRVQRKAVAAIGSRIAAPRPTMKLTPWRKDADGSLSRMLTADDDGEAAEINGAGDLITVLEVFKMLAAGPF